MNTFERAESVGLVFTKTDQRLYGSILYALDVEGFPSYFVECEIDGYVDRVVARRIREGK